MILKYINNIKTAFIGLVMALISFKPMPILVNLDFLANAIWGGDPQESISSRAGKLVRAGDRKFAYYLCRALNFISKGHCEKHIQENEGSDELIVLDRGAVIGTILFLTWPYYSDFVMPFIRVVL